MQPVQDLLSTKYADLVVFSLSKYPTLGETMGGVVVGNAEDLGCIREIAAVHGLLLSPEAAETAAVGLMTLNDRLDIVSEKAKFIAKFLSERSEIEEVFTANLSEHNAKSGGQITAKFWSKNLAEAVEHVISWNIGGDKFPLSLACTFGASITTYEYFVARKGSAQFGNAGRYKSPDGLVRIGIGHENICDIIGALAYSIEIASNNLEEICAKFPLSQKSRPDQSHGSSSDLHLKSTHDGERGL